MMTATWRFDDLVPNDQYVLALDDAVTDVAGNRLDGEWLNPQMRSEGTSDFFPSGNGQAGGDFSFVMTLLAGDFTLDNYVGYDDETIFWTNYYYVSDAAFTDGDADGDGFVSDNDAQQLYDTLNFDLSETWLLADLDGDFDVDEADAEILNGNIGMSNATWADGDLDGDGYVDSDDVDLMYAQYGLALDIAT